MKSASGISARLFIAFSLLLFEYKKYKGGRTFEAEQINFKVLAQALGF